MRKLVTLVTLFAASLCFAKPWHGLDPGRSTRAEVIQAFGTPSKTMLQQDGVEVLGYYGPKAVKGTTQAQFKIAPNTQLIVRIDVFPSASISRDQIETSYGPECPAGILPEDPCFVRKSTGDKRTYYHYVRLGLAVFFQKDGETVQSMVFTAQPK